MIKLKKVKIGYDHISLFPPLSGNFFAGSVTAVIGINGAGKSTLLKTLAGLQPLQGGTVYFSGNKLPKIAYLPQQIELDYHFPILVSDLVAMGNWSKNGIFGGLNKYSSHCITEALEYVGLTKIANSPIREISGGQLKRVLLARLLVQQAPLILLDEPFISIDNITNKFLIKIIEKYHKQGRTIIIVLHDISMIINYFSNILFLTKKRYYWGKTNLILKQISKLNIIN